MPKFTEAEWQDFKKRTGYTNPEDDRQQQELARSKKMKDIENIQYYATDLAYALDIGEIADMWVETENGKQILRLRVIPKKHDEFRTIRAAPKQTAAKPRKARNAPENYKPVAKRLEFERNVPEPESFGAKAGGFAIDVAKGFGKWLRTPPRKKPEDW